MQGGGEKNELNIIHDHGLLVFFSFCKEGTLYLGSMKIGGLAPKGFSFSLKKKSQEGFWLVLMQTWCNWFFLYTVSQN